MSRLTHNLNIGADTWHSKWYHSWMERTGHTQANENLCHYVRVLLIWAPIAWFVKGRIFRVIPPWALTLGVIVSTSVAVAFYLWPTDVLLILAILVGVCALLALVVGVLWIIEEGPDWALIVLLVVTFPIWIVPFLVVWPIMKIWDKYDQPITSFRKWWTRPRFALAGMTPVVALSIALVVTALGALAVFDTKAFLTLLLYAVIFVVGVTVAVALAAGLVFLLDVAKERHQTGQPVLGKKVQAVGETVRLGATYVASKKRGSRICPFINFEDTDKVDLNKAT